jgi:hypothetical protein
LENGDKGTNFFRTNTGGKRGVPIVDRRASTKNDHLKGPPLIVLKDFRRINTK